MSSDESRPEPDDTDARSAAESAGPESAGPESAGPETEEEATTESQADDTDPDGEDTGEDTGGETDEDKTIAGRTPRRARSGPPRIATIATAAVALAALVVAVVFGVLWQNAEGSDKVYISQARDRVLNTATEAAVSFTELDSSKAGEYFGRQKKLAIGGLRDEIVASEKKFQQTLDGAKTKVTSTVQDVAVEELNVHEGKADVLAVVNLEVRQQESDKAAPKTLRMQLRMERDHAAAEASEDQPWKVAGVAEVPYGVSG